MNWLGNLRRRALWVVVCLGAMALALIAWTTIPAWPVVGVAVAAAALVLNSVTSRLSAETCLSCGSDISDCPAGVHGRICRECGAINERVAAHYMLEHHDDDRKA